MRKFESVRFEVLSLINPLWLVWNEIGQFLAILETTNKNPLKVFLLIEINIISS